MTRRPRVSVIVPAHDAADTLAETLDSLLAQSDGDWEAVVVNDGSTDATGEIAAAYAERDPRVRVVTQPQGGEGAARNSGIDVARGDWILFLDADDWMAPDALGRFAAAVAPNVDAVIGGWERVTTDGTHLRDSFRQDTSNLFPVLARFCPFAIHSCLVSAARVREIGGFEPGLRVGADWDFWQRIARTGARFVAVDEVVAYYRMRMQSAAINVPRLVEAGRRLIALGHGADPRVASPDPRYADGMPAAEIPGALLRFIVWPAGILIGEGEDAEPLLAPIDDARDAELEPAAVANSLFLAALLPESASPSWWATRWPEAEPRVRAFLAALECTSGTRDLATRALLVLARLALLHGPASASRTLATLHHATIDVAVPVGDVVVNDSVNWLMATVVAGGSRVGDLELPVCDGLVPAAVIADAIADQFGWILLGRLFACSIYPGLERRPEDGRVEAWRGCVRVAAALPEGASVDSIAFHDAVGWTVLMQELWGEPQRESDWFYAGVQSVEADTDAPCIPFEISGPLGDLPLPVGAGSMALVELRIGGIPVALVSARASEGVIQPAAVRGQVMRVGGYEVARIAVREGIIGRPLDEPVPLRARLAESAARAGAGALPRWAADIADGALILGRRDGPIGSAASRRAVLPAAAAGALRETARVYSDPSNCIQRVLYVPELLHGRPPAMPNAEAPATDDRNNATKGFDRHHFETVFAAARDPWSYATPFEELKYEQTIALIEACGSTRRVLELACAEGMFTERLAPRVGELLATDIAQIAVDRTAERCARLPNVRAERLDIARDEIPSGFDTIVCSEVLYYLGGRAELGRVARKIADALAPGAHIVTVHCNVVVDDATSPGLDWDVPIGAKGIGEVFGAVPELRFREEWRTPLYRIQLFERVGFVHAALRRLASEDARRTPRRVRDVAWTMPAPHVAARFLMQGGKPRRGHLPVAATYELPILMYHSVAPDGPSGFARYRVSPAALEAQLRYLRDAGFRSVTLDEWRRAKEAWTPLDGRAVMLTFDDGYRDFADHAWPLLKRFGFGALVFLVTDSVGGTSAWAAEYGEPVPLLDWDTVRRLQSEGTQFGSHAATHRFLTGASPAEVASEAARSRVALARELGREVDAIAYPHGAEDPAIQHLVGACGYTYGLSCRAGRSRFTDPLLALHRIEVKGNDTLHDFISRLG